MDRHVTQTTTTQTSQSPRIALTLKEACDRAGVGRSTLYRAAIAGKLAIRKLGGKSIILAADLDAWLSNLPLYSPKSEKAKPTAVKA